MQYNTSNKQHKPPAPLSSPWGFLWEGLCRPRCSEGAQAAAISKDHKTVIGGQLWTRYLSAVCGTGLGVVSI